MTQVLLGSFMDKQLNTTTWSYYPTHNTKIIRIYMYIKFEVMYHERTQNLTSDAVLYSKKKGQEE